jgi:2-polyprenyl-3-methyl-5-hydroxy-6-metoxy-1,4-benzoquinol methylase
MKLNQREIDLKEHYNSHIEYYSPAFKPKLRGKSALDLGCGTGYFTYYLWSECAIPDVTGIDYSRERIKVAKQYFGNNHLKFHTSDIYEWLKNETFNYDIITAIETLEHLQNPRWVINQCLPRCKKLIATVPINMPYIAHLQVFTNKQDVQDKLSPDKIDTSMDSHFILEWKGKL